MRKLTFSEWIAVAAAIIVIAYFFQGSIFSVGTVMNPIASVPAEAPTTNNVESSAAISALTSTMTNENTFTLPGIQVTDVVVGTGEEAVTGKTVVVNYTGMFTDGKVFDSSIPRGTPFDFPLGAGRVIKGWDEGVVGMKVGGKRILVISPEKAYGETGQGPIPPNTVLVFEVELLDVQ